MNISENENFRMKIPTKNSSYQHFFFWVEPSYSKPVFVYNRGLLFLLSKQFVFRYGKVCKLYNKNKNYKYYLCFFFYNCKNKTYFYKKGVHRSQRSGDIFF